MKRKLPRTRYKAGIRPLRSSDSSRRRPRPQQERCLQDVKMALTGKQKAALLLKNLDPATAAELLKGVDTEVVQELAVELAHLDAVGFGSNKQSQKLARQFCNSLQADEEFHLNGFLKEVLKSSVGDERTEQIQTQMEGLLCKDDPFLSIRSADSQTLASIFENEHPQTAAVVLSELSAEKKSEVLGFLDWRIRISVVNRMSSCEAMTTEAKTRIAGTVFRRFKAVANSTAGKALPTRPEPSVRKMAVTLRNLGKEIREDLLSIIRRKDNQTGKMVADLMIVWEDIPQFADRSLRRALRRIDVKKLALALVRADDKLAQKIQSNISEPMAAMLNEHSFLVSAYKKQDVERAREEIVQVLHGMYEKGELTFIEE